jgi:hypothetical protein
MCPRHRDPLDGVAKSAVPRSGLVVVGGEHEERRVQEPDQRLRAEQREDESFRHPIRRLDDVKVQSEPAVLAKTCSSDLQSQPCFSGAEETVEPTEIPRASPVDVDRSVTSVRRRLSGHADRT